MHIEHEFEDLGLTLDRGWSIGGNIDGMCTIEFNSDGDWRIGDIWVDLPTGTKSHKGYLLDRSKPKERRRYHDIRDLIRELHSELIREKVAEALPDTYTPQSTISAGRTL